MNHTRVITTIVAIILQLAGLALSTTAAGDLKAQADGTTVWQAGIDGVEIEWAPDGSINRIYSRGSHDVRIPDRPGMDKAKIIAEEKAKAAIVRFMDQSISSGRVVTEVDSDLQQATRERGDGKADSVSKLDQRTMMESLNEVTSSWSSGTLRGVVVLEKGYDQDNEVAWVKVGISQKTIDTSVSLEKSLSGKGSMSSKDSGSSTSAYPGSEVSRTNMTDW